MKLKTKNGTTTIRLNYDLKNGRARNLPSRVIQCELCGELLTIGKVGERQKKFSDCLKANGSSFGSETDIRNYMAEHRTKMFAILNEDQRYVFYREAGSNGPLGSGGTPIAPRHTFATDPAVIPTGSISMFNTKRPEGTVGKCDNITSIAAAQDSGEAIRTGAHVDWYAGDGVDARKWANAVNFPGSLFIALPHKPVADCGK